MNKIFLQAGVNNSGELQYANINLYEDNGYMVNENIYGVGYDSINNCCPSTKISYKCYNVITDTPKNTFCRAPGKKIVVHWLGFSSFTQVQRRNDVSWLTRESRRHHLVTIVTM